MKRIIFAVMFLVSVIVLFGLIPDNINAQYPTPEVTSTLYPTSQPFIQGTPFPDGLRINSANCSRTSIEWNYRSPQDEVESFFAVFSVSGGSLSFPAPFNWGNQDVEYWLAEYNEYSNLLEGKVWLVQGVGYVPGFPQQPHYFTDIVSVDCTQILKHRVRMPTIFKNWR